MRPDTECTYPQWAQDRAFLALWVTNATWCPELQLSDHSSFMDRAATERWLAGDTTIVTGLDTVLRHGPGGVRVGNLPLSAKGMRESVGTRNDLGKTIETNTRPGEGQDPSTAVLHSCGTRDRLRDTDDFIVSEFVDGLFPMAQGITE